MSQAGKNPPLRSDLPADNAGFQGTFLRSSEVDSDVLRDAAREIFFSAGPALAQIETRMRACFVSEAPQLAEIAVYLLELGGKRIRPLLAVLSARLFKMVALSDKLIDAASGIELIHMATLLHDDIIDQSAKRRNKESALIRYGFTPSLLAGDFLWVRAFGLCAHLGEFIVTATERACVELTEGEILEGKLHPEEPCSLDTYLDIVGKKTAALFSLSAAVGAHCAGATTEETSALSRFGRYTGICFQMVDDILDVVADEDLLGKPSGTDLRQRTPSLVNILWLRSDDAFAKRYFSADKPDELDTAAAIRSLRDSEVIGEAREIAKSYAAKALAELDSIPGSSVDAKSRQNLRTLVDFTLERCL